MEHIISGGLGNIGAGLNSISNNLYQGIPDENYNYSLEEASLYLKIPENKLIEIVDDGGIGIPYIKIGNEYIFNRNALDKWLETAIVEIK